jgi:hypothetical protein
LLQLFSAFLDLTLQPLDGIDSALFCLFNGWGGRAHAQGGDVSTHEFELVL